MEFFDKAIQNNTNLPLLERIRLARERREIQVKNYQNWSKEEQSNKKISKTIKFTPDIEILEAVVNENLDELKVLLDKGINPNYSIFDDLTPLHHACIEGNLDIVKLLLRKGASIDAKDEDGWTPLHSAATCGHKEIVELLVIEGANIAISNNDGDMAYEIAEDKDIISFLKKQMIKQGVTKGTIKGKNQIIYQTLINDIQKVIFEGGNVDIPVSSEGAEGTFLHIAICHYYNDLVKLLLNYGASDKVVDADGWRPIHVATYWENTKAVEMLVKKRDTDLQAMTYNGETPYDLCENPHFKIYLNKTLNKEKNSGSNGEVEIVISKMDIKETNLINNNEKLSYKNDNSEMLPVDAVDNYKSFIKINSNDENDNILNLINISYNEMSPLFNPKMNENFKDKKGSPLRDAKKHTPIKKIYSNEQKIKPEKRNEIKTTTTNFIEYTIKYNKENEGQNPSQHLENGSKNRIIQKNNNLDKEENVSEIVKYPWMKEDTKTTAVITNEQENEISESINISIEDVLSSILCLPIKKSNNLQKSSKNVPKQYENADKINDKKEINLHKNKVEELNEYNSKLSYKLANETISPNNKVNSKNAENQKNKCDNDYEHIKQNYDNTVVKKNKANIYNNNNDIVTFTNANIMRNEKNVFTKSIPKNKEILNSKKSDLPKNSLFMLKQHRIKNRSTNELFAQ